MSEIDLMTPLAMGDITLSNRVVMAPLTRNRATDKFVPQEMNVLHYTQRASAGLIITEGSQISPQGMGYPLTPGIYNQEQVQGWKKVTDAVHERGGRIYIQLWHVGRISHPSMQPDNALPVAPSAIKPQGDAFTYSGLQPFVTPRALDADELPAIVNDYKNAAKNALAAGFDGVEIHAANGYLLDQFLRDGTNQRTDAYGGSYENRTRLLMDVLNAVIEVCGSQRVAVRLSPLNPFNDISDTNPEALFSYVVKQLNPLNLAYLHVVEGGTLNMELDPKTVFDVNVLRELYDGVYIANGGYNKSKANEALKAGHADLISFGELYIANPDLVERFKSDAELNTVNPETYYGGNEVGYTDYPFMSQTG